MRDSDRLFELRQLIRNNDIESQAQLKEMMGKRGYSMTLSSLSRDLTAIHAQKVKAEGEERRGVYKLMEDGRYTRIAHSQQMKGEEKHWFVQYVRMYHEKQVAAWLAAKDLECWLPAQTVRKRWSDRVKIQKTLVITKTVFVHCTESQRLKDTFCDYSMGYMIDRMTTQVAIIPDEQMRTFMKVIEQSEQPVTFTEELLQPGEMVQIMSGPLAGETAELCNYKGEKNVVIRLNGLGAAIMSVQLSDIAPLKE